MSSPIPPGWPLYPPQPVLRPLDPPLASLPPLDLSRAMRDLVQTPPDHPHKRSLPSVPEVPSPKRFCPVFKHEPALPELSESTTLTAPLSPPSPLAVVPSAPAPAPAPTPAPAATDKFTKSRAVGQVHRDKERQMATNLEGDVDTMTCENVLLFAMFCVRYKQDKAKQRLRESGEMCLPSDRPEDCGMSDEQALAMGWLRVRPETAERLGVRFVSKWMVRILLEYISVRRNYVPLAGGPNRKRRSSVRVAPSVEDARLLARYAYDMFCAEAAHVGAEDPAAYVDSKLGSLMYVLNKWSKFERENNVPSFDWDHDEEGRFPPKSPTRLDAPEFGSPSRRRGEGAKRCSRCGAIKFTGSGHGRSKCDDGYSISSTIPYPASPRSEENTSS